MVEGLHVMRRNRSSMRSIQFLGYQGHEYMATMSTRLKNHRIHPVQKSLGDLCGRGTPGPIPNPEAKPASADGTWGTRPWESRSSPRDFCLIVWWPSC